jgi:c-di-GMP-binding flagellar brake protein YcgR
VTDERITPSGLERRQAPRLNLSLPVSFSDVSTGRTYRATVDNISLGGVLLLTDAQLSEGTQIEIHLPIAADMTMRVEAVLARVADVGEFGIAFLSLTDDELDRLAAFVDQRAATQS